MLNILLEILWGLWACFLFVSVGCQLEHQPRRNLKIREGNTAPEKVLQVVMLGESRVTIPCLSFSLVLDNTQMGSDIEPI